MSQQEPSASPPPESKPPGSTGPNAPGHGTSGQGAGHRSPGGRGAGPHDVWATGGTVFAGMMLLIAGVLAILEGIVGIAKDVVYVVTRGDYVYKFDVTAWGWIHLILGIIGVLVGLGLLGGVEWARYAGILIAGLSLIAHFMFLPYQPVWSIIMIGIDTFIIWALASHHPRKARTGDLL